MATEKTAKATWEGTLAEGSGASASAAEPSPIWP